MSRATVGPGDEAKASASRAAAASRRCPICDHAVCERLHRQRFVLPENHPLTDGYEVVCCERCGFVYADTSVTQADYDRFYAERSKYEDNTTSTGGGGSPWDAQRLHETARDLAGFLFDRAARIVDVGCANGGLLAALKELGYTNLCGIDPSPACAQNVRRAHGIEAHAGSLDHVPAEVGAADAVLLSHVLEHVRELRPALAAVRGFMKPGALLYVEVPDATRYPEFLFAPFQDFNTEHINHFSSVSLANLLGVCGFEERARGQRLVATAPEMPYPAIYAIGKAPAASGDGTAAAPGTGAGSLVKDAELRPAIGRYIESSQRLLDAMDERIRDALADAGPILVWGTGQLATKLLAETSLGSAEIEAFVDGNPIHHGETIRGVPVLSPEQVRSRPNPILIASTFHEKAIARRISEDLGMTNRLITLGVVASASQNKGGPS